MNVPLSTIGGAAMSEQIVNLLEDPVSEETGWLDIFTERESEVRSYCRAFPAEFTTARGARIEDVAGRSYVDFFAGAGALNYGHNHPALKGALLRYIEADGLSHGLDFYTVAKERFLREFTSRVLVPRSLDYKVQFTGPTGTNAVEAALKIARRSTGRSGILAFMGGYHGHSLGSLAVTANRVHRAAAGVALDDATFLPFPLSRGGLGDTLGYLRMVLDDGHSGVDLPAAIIVETVQAEGGVNVAPVSWLRELRTICDESGILLIVDDIQTGCGRTGTFFSFERAGIIPDLVTISKSISGYGLPMGLTLMRPELDVWEPAEHTGTFRGNQFAFVTGAAALEVYDEPTFQMGLRANSETVQRTLAEALAELDDRLELRGLGMIWGIDTAAVEPTGRLAATIRDRCFDEGLIVELVGRQDSVLKLLPPLNIPAEDLRSGLEILTRSIEFALGA